MMKKAKLNIRNFQEYQKMGYLVHHELRYDYFRFIDDNGTVHNYRAKKGEREKEEVQIVCVDADGHYSV